MIVWDRRLGFFVVVTIDLLQVSVVRGHPIALACVGAERLGARMAKERFGKGWVYGMVRAGG